jgi:hypothetical protein
MFDIERTKARFVLYRTYASRKSVHWLCSFDTHAALPSLDLIGSVRNFRALGECGKNFQGAILQLLSHHARTPQFSLPLTAFRAVGPALQIARSVLFLQTPEQEYDQATLMSPASVVSRQMLFSTQVVPQSCSSCASEFPVLPQPERSR